MSAASAQVTSITGSTLALRSTGSSTLSTTGFVGSYLTVPAGGATVRLNANATGTAGHMNLVIADSKFGFAVAGGAAANYTTPDIVLPGGTYLVRSERDYNNGANAAFSVNSLSVSTISSTGGVAEFNNASNPTNAMGAADTYINNFRKGALDIAVQGIKAGTSVQVRLKNSDFKFGTAISDTAAANYLHANPTPGGTPAQYQAALLKNFNSVTPENAGKWSSSDGATQTSSDRMLNFAQRNAIRARQHTMVWGSQQPTRIFNDSNLTDPNALFTKARSTDPTIAAAAKAAIQTEISNRIANYVSGRNLQAGTNGPIRATQYGDLDVYNESYHTGSNAGVTTANYWQVLGASAADGPAIAADIYNRTKAAVNAAGASTRLFTNEYNVLNNDANQFGQWYSSHVESIRKAGGSVDGMGVQFYANGVVGTAGSNVNPARAYATLANLSAQGLPMELTEFGTPLNADPVSLTTAMRLAFGTPDMDGFTIWGFLQTPSQYAAAQGSALYALNGTNLQITAAGTAYEALHGQWTTDVTTTIGADGRISLPSGAFYGDYEVTIKGIKYGLEYDKGTDSYLLVVLKGDFNNDETRNGADLDALLAAVQGNVPTADRRFDINSDGKVLSAIDATASDTDYFVRVIEGSEYGDANLDGKVDFQDLVALAQNYNLSGVGWASGNFNGDAAVNFEDLVTLAQHYGFGTVALSASSFREDWAMAQAIAAVPEPTAMLLASAGAVLLRRRRMV